MPGGEGSPGCGPQWDLSPCPFPGVQGLGHRSCGMASPFLPSPGLLSHQAL